MTIPLSVIFGVLALGGAAVIYGTLARNRWGINAGDISCPRCKALLPKVRQPRSLRQEMWGGCTCANCGTEVDKWGRELPGRGPPEPRAPQSSPNGERTGKPTDTTPFGGFIRRSPAFWVIVAVLLLLNILYDYYHPLGVVFDAIAAILLLIWHLNKPRRA